jgi:hypothetical protein
VASAKAHLSALRTRLYPILGQWRKHNLTEQDNFYGFAHLDGLKDDFEQLEACLKPKTSKRKPGGGETRE